MSSIDCLIHIFLRYVGVQAVLFTKLEEDISDFSQSSEILVLRVKWRLAESKLG